MPQGTLEVLLVSAKGLDNNDFLADMDPYVILTLKTQDKKSTVVSGQGSEPEWNESFSFTVSDGVSELRLKIMDKDTFSADDFVGEATVPLEAVFGEGSLPPTPYNVVNQEKEYHGEIKVGLTFTPERSSGSGDYDEDSHGGRRGSSKGEERYGSGGGYGSGDYNEDSSHGGRRGSSYNKGEERYGGGDYGSGEYDEDSHGGRRGSSYDKGEERYGGGGYEEDSHGGRRVSSYNQERHGGGGYGSGDYDEDSHGGRKGSSYKGEERHGGGGWKDSSKSEDDSYGGWKESSYRG